MQEGEVGAGKIWGFPKWECGQRVKSPTLRQGQGRLSRKRGEKWGTRLIVVMFSDTSRLRIYVV